MKAFTIIMALVCFGYGVGCAIKGTIWVGSKSYSGGTKRYTRQENPLQFWFWCVLFAVIGILCTIGAVVGDQ